MKITVSGQDPQKLSSLFDSAEFENAYAYLGDDLGVTYTREKSVFKLWAPLAEEVSVLLFEAGDCETGKICQLPMTPQEECGGIWTAVIPGDCLGVYYTYRITIDGAVRETVDPYAKAVGLDGRRGLVVDLKRSNPPGWEKDSYAFTGKTEQAILWEAHVRDFSDLPSSGMRHAGKYAAFTEQDTSVPGHPEWKTGLAYLKELGITHVQLQPVFDFATVEEGALSKKYNWGYDPQNYNVPEGSYSEDPFRGEVRIKELKALVKALHEAGIGVVMDVVYNHSYEFENSVFQKTVPYYYYRMKEGKPANGSGCGTELATERLMVRKFILDSIRYWTEEYHIDGFRLDLMGLMDVETLNAIRDLLNALGGRKNLLLYGEPWAAEAPSMRKGSVPANKESVEQWKDNIAYFNDEGRDAIKGNTFLLRAPGFVAGAAGTERAVLEMGTSGQALRRIQYTSCHDNLTIWDKITETVQGDGSGFDAPELIRLAAAKLAATAVLMARGTAFLFAGEEFGRTKYADANSYRSPIEINGMEWSRQGRFRELLEYYRGLIAIRKRYLTTGEEPQMKELVCEPRYVGWEWCFPDRSVSVFLNSSDEPRRYRWTDVQKRTVLANETLAGTKPLGEPEGEEMTVAPRGVMVVLTEK